MSRFRLSDLNPEQQRAATHENGPLLILAGAGTGYLLALVDGVLLRGELMQAPLHGGQLPFHLLDRVPALRAGELRCWDGGEA